MSSYWLNSDYSSYTPGYPVSRVQRVIAGTVSAPTTSMFRTDRLQRVANMLSNAHEPFAQLTSLTEEIKESRAMLAQIEDENRINALGQVVMPAVPVGMQNSQPPRPAVAMPSESVEEVKKMLSPSFLEAGDNSVRFSVNGEAFHVRLVENSVGFVSAYGKVPLSAKEKFLQEARFEGVFIWNEKDVMYTADLNGIQPWRLADALRALFKTMLPA